MIRDKNDVCGNKGDFYMANGKVHALVGGLSAVGLYVGVKMIREEEIKPKELLLVSLGE